MSDKRISREKLTTKKVTDLYQAKYPQASAESEYYEALFVHVQKRLDRCVFGGKKPACEQCPVHRYQPTKHEETKQTMRWVGPRMLWCHLILTMHHLVDDKRPVPELPEKYRPRKAHEQYAGQADLPDNLQLNQHQFINPKPLHP